jgi:hypothetical protein
MEVPNGTEKSHFSGIAEKEMPDCRAPFGAQMTGVRHLHWQ